MGGVIIRAKGRFFGPGRFFLIDIERGQLSEPRTQSGLFATKTTIEEMVSRLFRNLPSPRAKNGQLKGLRSHTAKAPSQPSLEEGPSCIRRAARKG